MGVLESVACLFLALKMAKHHPIARADAREIEREDDVLLQGITFASAVLFFYVNMLTSDMNVKFWVSLMIICSTGSFYLFRALAKIKSDPYYRFYSAFLLVWVACSYVFEFVVIFFPVIFPKILSMPPLAQVSAVVGFTVIPILLTALAGAYLPQRYGVKSFRQLKNKEEKTYSSTETNTEKGERMPITDDEWKAGRKSDTFETEVLGLLKKEGKPMNKSEIVNSFEQSHGTGFAGVLAFLITSTATEEALKNLTREGSVEARLIRGKFGTQEIYFKAR
jgi:hypothetical protein